MPSTILVVDDEAILRALTIRMLEAAGFEAFGTESAETGLELLRRGFRADLMLADVRLSGLNGVELARAAWELRPDLPVLFISGYSEPKVLQDAKNAALLHNFLPKPYNSEQLVSAVRRLLPESA